MKQILARKELVEIVEKFTSTDINDTVTLRVDKNDIKPYLDKFIALQFDSIEELSKTGNLANYSSKEKIVLISDNDNLELSKVESIVNFIPTGNSKLGLKKGKDFSVTYILRT